MADIVVQEKMKNGRLKFLLTFYLAIVVLTACKPRSQTVEPNKQPSPLPSLTPQPTPTPTPTPAEKHLNLTALVGTIRPAVILVTVFDSSGKSCGQAPVFLFPILVELSPHGAQSRARSMASPKPLMAEFTISAVSWRPRLRSILRF